MSTTSTDLDYALLRRVAKGEHAAFEELVRRHQRSLYNLAYRLLRHPQEAEDALQEVFLKVYEHAASYQPSGTVKSWMNRICANHCLNRLRRLHPQESLDDEERGPSLAAAAPDPLQSLEGSALAGQLEELLASLPEKQRQALILKQFGDLSYQEIAEILGTTPSAVDGLLKRARQFLRRALAGYLD